MAFPTRNSVFGRFSCLHPHPPPPQKRNIYCYCRLAVSDFCVNLEGFHFCGPKIGECLRTPNPYNLSEKYWRYLSDLYCSTPPMCNAVPRWLQSFGEKEAPQYTSNCTLQHASHLYRSAPPICTGDNFEKIPGVGGSEKFLTKILKKGVPS